MGSGVIRGAMAAVVILACAVPLAAQDDSAEDLYARAWLAETEQRNLDRAMELYEEVLKQHSHSESYAAKALLRIGRCLEKKGKQQDARRRYEELIERFPRQTELVAQARERLSLSQTGGGQEEGSEENNRQKASERTRARLAKEKMNVDFNNTPLTDVLEFIFTLVEVNVAIDYSRIPSPEEVLVTLKVMELSVDQVLRLTLSLQQLEYYIARGVVVVTTPDGLAAHEERLATRAEVGEEGAPLPPEAAAVLDRIRSLTLDLHFVETPLEEVVEFIRMFAEVNIIMAPDLASDPPVITFKASKLSLEATLDVMCACHGLDYHLENGVIVLGGSLADQK